MQSPPADPSRPTSGGMSVVANADDQILRGWWRGISHVLAAASPPLVDRSGRLLDLLHRLSEVDQQRTERRLSQPAEVPSLNRYVALWMALACITAIVLLVPNVPVAINEPRLSIAVGSV